MKLYSLSITVFNWSNKVFNKVFGVTSTLYSLSIKVLSVSSTFYNMSIKVVSVSSTLYSVSIKVLSVSNKFVCSVVV